MSFAELRLSLPQQQLQADHQTIVRYKDVVLGKLSDSDLFVAQADTVISHLHNMNRSSISGDTRYSLLSPVLNRYMSLLFELRDSCKPSVMSELNKEASVTCKLLLRDCPPHSTDEKAQFIQWTMVTLGEQIRDHFEKYLSEPKDLWGELHRLYQHASDQRLTEFFTAPLNRTIEQTYKQILMLAAAEPHHLSLKESRNLYYWLGQNSDRIQLRLQERKDLYQNYYYIDPLKNDGVLSHREVGGQANGQAVLCMNPLPLISLAKEQMQMIRKGQPINGMGFPEVIDPIDGFLLLRKSAQAWARTTSRRHEREQCHKTAELAIGLHQIHGALKKSAKNNQVLVNATVVNKSKGGVCLQINPGARHQPHVGEVIAEREEGGQKQRLGVIRWLKSTVDNLLFGIEFITGMAQPVAIKIKDKLAEALLVSAAQMDTLITNSGIYRSGEPIRVKLPHRDMMLQAVSGPLVSRQGDTDQFRITRS